MFYVKYAVRSLVSRYRQYRSLFAVCAAAVCIIFSVTMITDGMLEALRGKAKQYYGGDIQFIGGVNYNLPDADKLVAELRSFLPASVHVYRRFDYDGSASSLYFEGGSSRIRIIKGVDFRAEQTLFSRFTFVEGNAAERPKNDSILLSEPVARKLGVHIGDNVTIFMRTIRGYNNTMTLVVSGIFMDSSLFGMYTAYMDIRALRTVSGYSPSYVNRICLYYPEKSPSAADVKNLQHKAEQIFNMFPLTDNKQEFYNAMSSHSEKKPLYALITLQANRKELGMLTGALALVVLLIVIPLVLIVAVGIGSSYRVIVIKRTTETGTFRAIGMGSDGVIKIFITEAFFLLAGSFIFGTLLSALAMRIIALFDFSFIPAFDMFLVGGHLQPSVYPIKLVCLLCCILITTLGAVLFTLRRLVAASPINALASAE